MIRFFTALIFVLLLSVNTYSTEHLRNSDADARIRGTEELWFKSGSSVPSYIRFQKGFVLEEKDVFSWLKDKFKLEPGLNYILKESHQTEDQIRHTVYTAVLNDVQFEFTRLIVHTQGQRVLAISGEILDRCHVGNLTVLTAAQALDIALAAKGAAVYKWQVPAEESWLQETTGNVNATFYPRPELVIVAAGGNYKIKEFRHAYKMNLYSHVPLSSENYYVDAESGQVIFIQNMWNDVDSTGVAHTAFSGIRLIKSQYKNLKFNLVESDRGNGIHTWNMKNMTDFSSAVDFEDEDNNWTFTQGDLDAYATDAHWGAEMTYDYLKATFNRNSINDSGFVLNNYVHFGESYNNARWDRQLKIMMFGDGPSNLIPLTTLDIVAHEIGHGLTQFTADLIYMDEPGALNESFSDILGNSVEFFGKPGTASWRIGEDMGDFVRDMAFPNAKGHPDTYKGDYWYTGLDDNGGVHTNSGVQNYWFYLLSESGNGINDFNVSYDVQGIGISNAALIAYRTLSVYLTPTSDYEEASFYSTMAAVDIFGNCSFQHESVVKAWNAVGLQNQYIDYTLADFRANNVNFCNLPITMAFANLSLNGEEYVWDFGDGVTSTLASPTHIYTQPGSYTVKLTADGKGCGTDEIIKENLVQAFETEIPGVSPATIYKGDSTVLYASTSRGEINWYADENGNNWLKKGNSFQTPKLDKTTTYYLRTTVEGSLHGIGEEISDNLSQGQFSNLNVGLIFNTYQDVVIHSVKVNSESAGDRTFQVKNESGSVIFDKTVALAAGVQEVILDAVVQAGSAYQMTYSGALKNLWMGAQTNYPYEYSGLLSITGNSMGLNDVYAYFFDWQVKEMDCNSDMKEVVVSVEDINTVKKEPYKFYVNNPDDFNYYIDFFFRDNTNVNFGLYGINGQRVHEFEKEYTKGATTDNVNILFGLDSYPSGVYFITINGGGIEKTEKIISKGGSD